MTPLPLASTQFSSTLAILVTLPERLVTATSPERFTEVREGSASCEGPVL